VSEPHKADAGTVYNPFIYDGTDAQLQWMLLLGIVVAGKVARTQEMKLRRFLGAVNAYAFELEPDKHTPFSALRALTRCNRPEHPADMIRFYLEAVKMGQYSRIAPAFTQLATSDIDLRACSRDDICGIHGIGLKTASFFILFSRRDAAVACLDTHILAFMKEKGITADVPRQPRSRKDYLRLETAFIDYCKNLGRPIGEVDFEIWLARNRGDK
jgi:hypothetical protein